MLRIHNDTWRRQERLRREWWLRHTDLVDQIHFQLYGLYPGGDFQRAAIVDWLIKEVADSYTSGALFSVTAVERFGRYSDMISTWGCICSTLRLDMNF